MFDIKMQFKSVLLLCNTTSSVEYIFFTGKSLLKYMERNVQAAIHLFFFSVSDLFTVKCTAKKSLHVINTYLVLFSEYFVKHIPIHATGYLETDTEQL